MRGHHPSWESLSEDVAQLFPTSELGFRKCVFFTEVFPCLRVFYDRLVPGLSFALTQVHHALHWKMGMTMTG